MPASRPLRITIVLLLLAVSGCVKAKSFEDGEAAANKRDHATALLIWRPLAELGFAAAQVNLGAMYAEGRGVPKDDAEAAKWYRRAAERGHAAGQTNLGVMYAEGRGVTEDDAEAVKWFRLAAEQGAAAAQDNLGFMYDNGQGVPRDTVEAVKWFAEPPSRDTPPDKTVSA